MKPLWSNKMAKSPGADATPTPSAGVETRLRVTTRVSAMGGDGKEAKPKKVLHGNEYQYELEQTLGKGSYAKVKLCRTIETEATFAVKIFKVSLLKRRRMWDAQQAGFKTAFDDVLREIAIMKRLLHPNVMNMHDVVDDSHGNKLYMVMDYCPRGAIMETENMPCDPIDHENSRRWFADTAVGLDYLHFQGVVHYDLKPDNILVAEDGRAVISDFGVSRVHPNKSDTTVGSPGTPTYTAPEVWGSGSYHGKLADVWSLGVTLHAMVFGCLPYAATTPTDLIACVTDPSEWSCAHECPDSVLLAVLTGMMQKVPANRYSLEKVLADPWVATDVSSRKTVEWEKIVISEEEMGKAISHGHVANFKRTKRGTLLKLTDESEEITYRALGASECAGYLPKLINSQIATGKKRVILELEDLTHELEQPCLMDVKMGMRTFPDSISKSDATPRKDLLDKLLKVSADAASEEERRAGGVTKQRYLRFRDEASSTATLGFRVDAVLMPPELDGDAPDVSELRLVATREQVSDVVVKYMQGRRELLLSFSQQLRDLRSTLEGCEVFRTHAFIRSSLLFVYDGATNKASIRMIDLARVSQPTKADGGHMSLDHRATWEPGNHEDGYLTGIDNMIEVFEGLLSAQS
jgi:1D-myo-inositol-triphosphate 3-kinase